MRDIAYPNSLPWEGIGNLVIRSDVLFPSLLAALSQYANWATTLSFTPILARQLGATDVTQSALMSMHTVVVVLGSLLTAAIVRRIGARRLVYFGFVLLSAGIGGQRSLHRCRWFLSRNSASGWRKASVIRR